MLRFTQHDKNCFCALSEQHWIYADLENLQVERIYGKRSNPSRRATGDRLVRESAGIIFLKLSGTDKKSGIIMQRLHCIEAME